MLRPRVPTSVPALTGVLLVPALLWFGAIPAISQNTASIVGQVRTDQGGIIPSGVTVSLETSEALPVDQRPANSEGRFAFENLRKISYRLVVSAEGFQPAEKSVDLGYGPNQTIVNIFLTPLTKNQPGPAGVTTLTDMRASGKARKEYEKGALALEAKNLSEALDHFERAVAEYPCYARAQTDLAQALTMQRDFSRAEAALRKAIECEPGFLDAYTQLSQLFNAQRRYQDSVALLQQALGKSLSAWPFYYQLGVAQYGLGKFGLAEESYLKVQSLNPAPPPELHVKLADVYLKRAAYDRAYTEMQAYLRANPNGRFATKVKQIIHEMESTGVVRAVKPEPSQSQPTKP